MKTWSVKTNYSNSAYSNNTFELITQENQLILTQKEANLICNEHNKLIIELQNEQVNIISQLHETIANLSDELIKTKQQILQLLNAPEQSNITNQLSEINMKLDHVIARAKE